MRKHSEVIKAWLEGEEIQHQVCEGSDWFDGSQFVNPISTPQLNWRVKPKFRIVKIPTIINASNVEAYYDEELMEIVVKFDEVNDDI